MHDFKAVMTTGTVPSPNVSPPSVLLPPQPPLDDDVPSPDNVIAVEDTVIVEGTVVEGVVHPNNGVSTAWGVDPVKEDSQPPMLGEPVKGFMDPIKPPEKQPNGEGGDDVDGEFPVVKKRTFGSQHLPPVEDGILEKFLSLYVDWPHTCCAIGFCTIFLLGVLSLLVGGMTMTLDVDDAWAVHRGEFTKSRNMFRLAQQSALETGLIELARSSGAGGEVVLEEYEPRELKLLYKAGVDGQTVYTPKRLRDMCELEKLVVTQDWCKESSCIFYSPVRTFYTQPEKRMWTVGNLPWDYDWSCNELPQAHVDEVLKQMHDSTKIAGTSSPFAPLLHPDFARAADSTAPVLHARSSIHIMGKNDTDEAAEEFVVEKFMKSFNPPLEYAPFKSAFEGEDRDVHAPWTSDLRVRMYYPTDEFMRMLGPDFFLAIFSIIFVFFTIWAHVGSLLLAAAGMFQIVWSLFVAGLIYRKIFMVDYFEFLHILIVYLVLGIGADDVFVLIDTFRHIKENVYIETPGRLPREQLMAVLRATWLRTAGAIFNTSFTTAVAFLSCSVSKVMPLRTCSWYAALCILMNYVFVILFTPAVLIVAHKRYESKNCCFMCPSPQIRPEAVIAEEAPAVKPKATVNGLIAPAVEALLGKVYVPLLSKKIGRFKPLPTFLVVVLGGVAIQGVYFTSQLTPPSKPEIWFPANHMWNGIGVFMIETSYLPNHLEFAEMHFTWGISDLDFSNFNEYNPDEHRGDVQYDRSFDLSTAEAQNWVLDTCKELRELRCDLKGCRNDGFGTLALQKGNTVAISCFLEDFQAWYRQQVGNPTADMPTGDDFVTQLKNFRTLTHSNKDPMNTSTDLLEHDYFSSIGFFGNDLRYATVSIRSSLLDSESYMNGIGVANMMTEWVKTHNANAPASVKSLQVASNTFAGYDLGRELVDGLFQGCTIAGPVSFLVLLFSTHNVILALYAIASVGSIVCCVLGFCKNPMDWDLGIGEAVAGVIVIGYSVDYVVHLAHIYAESKHFGRKTREERAMFAIENMGSTVFAGSLTTAGSGAFMFGCFLTFFFKMALLICMTIGFSFLYSVGFFTGLLFLIGPEGNFGELRIPNFMKPKRAQER
eukprot:TRINITY_DN101271_c0_g1_i1.p1 TRINITY_DN101271_c0_g1~~TRINITY_DN101271_c0_g1_i1.p1  ORF type:complete len:1102 (+),score=237.23 TRINITY_DN101271_c0_g1_i1:27-3332(+)